MHPRSCVAVTSGSPNFHPTGYEPSISWSFVRQGMSMSYMFNGPVLWFVSSMTVPCALSLLAPSINRRGFDFFPGTVYRKNLKTAWKSHVKIRTCIYRDNSLFWKRYKSESCHFPFSQFGAQQWGLSLLLLFYLLSLLVSLALMSRFVQRGFRGRTSALRRKS